jgi:hypothetical protein
MEKNIQTYLSGELEAKEVMQFLNSPYAADAKDGRVNSCRAAGTPLATNVCELPLIPLSVVYQRRDGRGRIIFTNE